MSNDNKDPEEIRRKLRENLEKFKNSREKGWSSDSNSTDNNSTNNNSTNHNSNDSNKSSSEDKEDSSSKFDFFKRSNNSNNSFFSNKNDDYGNDNGGNDFKIKMPQFNFPNFNPKLVSVGVLLALLIPYFAMGFYTVNEQNKGVVTRFGQYVATSEPGLNWRAPLIDEVKQVNVSTVNELKVDGVVLTRDENVVNVEMNVQYQIRDPKAYLFNVVDPRQTLEEATESSLRYVLGHMDMDEILTTGRSEVRVKTAEQLKELMDLYNAGIEIKSLNFQSARPPEEVKEAFDDAIKAQEDEERFKREATAYKLSQEPIARGNAQQIIYQAQAYAKEKLAHAEGLAVEFNDLLPEYLNNPTIFKQRYYLETMASIYGVTPKVILEDGITLNFLNLDNLLQSTPPETVDPGTPIPYVPSRMAVPRTNYIPSTVPTDNINVNSSNNRGNSIYSDRNTNNREPVNRR